jgi:hypothetical protein
MMYVANILFGLVAVVRATLTSRAGVAGANIAYVAVLRTIADAALAKRLLAVEVSHRLRAYDISERAVY